MRKICMADFMKKSDIRGANGAFTVTISSSLKELFCSSFINASRPKIKKESE
jgi:hypothetical protein